MEDENLANASISGSELGHGDAAAEVPSAEPARRPRADAAPSPRAASARPPRRLAREEKTIATMIGMYCRDHHKAAGAAPSGPVGVASGDSAEATTEPRVAGGLCEECAALLSYARARLDRCPFGVDKPTCAKCTTHCYKPAMREQVRAVMRYAGPRMVKEHPVLAAAHLTDGRRKTPPRG